LTGALARQRCLQHPDREAAYRCPVCKRHYCRECGVEHDGRILCVACLRKETATRPAKSARWSGLAIAASPFIGFLIAWLFFFYLGQWLISIPTAFHEGKLP
jgi:hypothetical protein